MIEKYCYGICDNYEPVNGLYQCKWVDIGHQCNCPDTSKKFPNGFGFVQIGLTATNEIQLNFNSGRLQTYLELEPAVAKQLAESILKYIKENKKKGKKNGRTGG